MPVTASKSAISVRNRISKKCGHKVIFKEMAKERKDQHDLGASVVAQNHNVNQILNDIQHHSIKNDFMNKLQKFMIPECINKAFIATEKDIRRITHSLNHIVSG